MGVLVLLTLGGLNLCPVRYDITGVQPDRVQEIIEADWYHLLQEQRFLLSPNYLREGGKAVIAIWGAQLYQLTVIGNSLSCILFFPRFRLQRQQTHTRPNARVDHLFP